MLFCWVWKKHLLISGESLSEAWCNLSPASSISFVRLSFLQTCTLSLTETYSQSMRQLVCRKCPLDIVQCPYMSAMYFAYVPHIWSCCCFRHPGASSESNGLGLSQPTRDLISHGIPGVLIRAKCPKLCPQSNVSRVSQEECARLVPHECTLPRAAHATLQHKNIIATTLYF